MKQVTSSLIILLFICPILSLNAPSNAEDITTLSDGLPATDVMFYKAGENNSLSFKVPRDRMVANISLDLRGVSWENPDEKEMVVEYSHEWNNKAWSGTFDGNMMGSPLNYQEEEFSEDDYGKILFYEMEWWTNSVNQVGNGSFPYHHYSMEVPDVDIASMSIFWFGGSWIIKVSNNATWCGFKMYMYNFDTQSWDFFGGKENEDFVGDHWMDMTFKREPTEYLDEERRVHILSKPSRGGPEYNTTLWTNVINITIVQDNRTVPENVTLDVADDGDADWSYPGPLTGTVTAAGRALADEANDRINSTSPSFAEVDVLLSFTTDEKGIINISNIVVDLDDPPEFLAPIPSDMTFDEDTDAYDLIDLNDYFKDEDDRLRYTIISNTNPLGIDASIGDDGKMDLFTPTEDWYGKSYLVVRAEDRLGQYNVSNEFKVTVLPVDDPPVLTEVGNVSIPDGHRYQYSLQASDGDMLLDPTEELRFFSDSQLFVVGSRTGTIDIVPTEDHIGSHDVKFTVVDSKGLEDWTIGHFEVYDVNNPPVVTGPLNMTLLEDTYYRFRVDIDDPDADDTHTFSSEGDLFAISSDGLIELTPRQGDVGDHEMVVHVSDGQLETEVPMLFTVKNVNDAPIIQRMQDVTASFGRAFKYKVNASDEDLGYDPKETLIYSETSPLFDIDMATGEINFTPKKEDIGPHQIIITVRDKAMAKAMAVLNLTIRNDPPIVELSTQDNRTTFDQGGTIRLEALARDMNGDALTYTWRKGKDGRPVDGGSSMDFKADEAGKVTYHVHVSDGIDTTVAEVTVTVKGSGSGVPGFDMTTTAMTLLSMLVLPKALWRGRKH